MSITVAVAGKGGTGKTTLAALLVKYFREKGKGPVLAIDADPNANLGESLGLEGTSSVGSMLKGFIEHKEDLPASLPKENFLELKLNEILIEDKNLDLLVMGGKEGPGCYCYPNLILRKYIDLLAGNYPFVVLDNEAGMEHLSRRTTQKVDWLFLVATPTPKGVRTAERISHLTKDLNLEIADQRLVVNMTDGLDSKLKDQVDDSGLELAGEIPIDKAIGRFDMDRESLLNLPDDSPAVRAVEEMMGKILGSKVLSRGS